MKNEAILYRFRDIIAYFARVKKVTWQWPRPFQGQFVIQWVTWRDHAHFRDDLSSVGWDLLCSTHITNLKCLRLTATKKWKATPNVKILVLSHPLGALGIMHKFRLSLNGKHNVDFLLVIIELFSVALTAEALLSKICWNRHFLKELVTLSANFS